MVVKYRKGSKTSVKADVIVLGCSLPGMIIANKLKKKFGNTMDIVVLDLAGVSRVFSKCNVAFQDDTVGHGESESSDDNEDSDNSIQKSEKKNLSHECTKTDCIDTVAMHYLLKYASEFKVPLPAAIINSTVETSALDKIFQYPNGEAVPCKNSFNEFNYLNFLEKFELHQYQKLLDNNMKRLFHANLFGNLLERDRLLYYDQTTMEKSICDALLFSTSREIMRTTVKLVCGAPAKRVSLLFYLHQCYRTSGTKHHIDGKNIRLREKLLGYCRKRLTIQLQADIADITLPAKSIKNIRAHSECDAEQVILETMMGETTYVCTLLAMALKPDQLQAIQVDNKLLTDKEAKITKSLSSGKAKKFLIQYEDNFWVTKGLSGDIFSTRGPIVWAIEKPSLSFTGSIEKYAGIMGYLMVKDEVNLEDSRNAVIQQLKELLGEEAGSPVSYRETSLADIFIPRCGDYIGLRLLTSQASPRGLEWGALDIFAEGDLTAALEAGHTAYLHLLSCLRPQAQTFEDISTTECPTLLEESPFSWWMAHINVLNSMKISIYATILVLSMKLIHHSFVKK